MEPLQATPMATNGVVVSITTENSWQAGTAAMPVLFAYVATNSTQKLSFVSLQQATRAEDVLMVASRPAAYEDMPYGVVVEVYLTKPLAEGESVCVALAQGGATIYFPPQPIADSK